MCATPGLVGLLEEVAREGDPEIALDLVTRAALNLTRSRNAMLAVMNDELGQMELRHGAGEDWSAPDSRELIRIDVAGEQGIVGLAAAKGEAIVIRDVQASPEYRQLYESTRSEIAVPVWDRHGRVRAVLNGESDRLGAYSEDDLAICKALSSIASIMLERSERVKREKALLMVGAALDKAHSEPELLARVIEVAGDVLRFQACSIFLHDPASGLYVLRASVGELAARVGEICYAVGEGCTGWVCQSGIPVRLKEPQKDPRWRGKYLEFPAEQIAAFLAVPIAFRGQCIGVIRAIRRVAESPLLDNSFTEDDEQVLLAIAEQVASGLENIRSVERIVRSERMAAWGELSAKSSHMIGNRVFALKGDINELEYQLSQDTPNIGTLRELASSLRANALRIDEILQDFRDFLSATQLTRQSVDLNGLVAETVSEVFPKRSPVKLHLKLAEGIPKLDLDPRRIQRAVSELVENALAWSADGVLSISTGEADVEEKKQAGLNEKRRFAKIVVHDSGPGVPAEKKSAIFQPFQSGRVKGMGLGLSIVKGIVEAHDGSVVENGEPGSGARFVILLPINNGAESRKS